MEGTTPHVLDLTGHWIGLAALGVFVVAYGAVMAEERLHLRKSQPVLFATAIIWLLVGVGFVLAGDPHGAEAAAQHNILEYAELFLFLLAAMTYVNTMEERGVFNALRAWLVGRGLSLRALFWVTGALAFVISPLADNLTTALLMGAVSVAVGRGRPAFVSLACINVVVAANAGGAFSPFGDITTLMVWQAGHVGFFGFFALLVPSLINWLVPAAIMAFTLERGRPEPVAEEVHMRAGALSVAALFVGTIAMTVAFHQFLHLPPALGMMGGLGVLKMYSYLLNFRNGGRAGYPAAVHVDEMDDVFGTPALVATAETEVETKTDGSSRGDDADAQRGGVRDEGVEVLVTRAGLAVPVRRASAAHAGEVAALHRARHEPLDIFRHMERVEWDTLMFFFGVILCVGGLGALGYLGVASRLLYGALGDTAANILVGVLSAVIDNVPVMFAVLQMGPELSQGQWLLVTLTAGVGGSMLSVGSAAGVALMGQARGVYTFMTHLKWAWAIALGYAASIAAHLVLNRHLF